MITTRESINYQFSLVFGYSSPNNENLIVGDVIGPGNLTRRMVQDLSIDVIEFLTQYNAMLRDYAGCEVFSVEFELVNIDEKDAQTKIYPKSMILIPGNYKECESLLLALKPETGYLNVHKSHRAINNISKLFFEVEDFVNRPELNQEERETVFQGFAERFNKKIFGNLLEDKWNKKLIGVSESLPTEKDLLKTYYKSRSNVEILWQKKPAEINLYNNQFENFKDPFDGKQGIEHLKFKISEPSALFVIENTLKLGTDLMELANTGTIDESQEKIIKYILSEISEELKEVEEQKHEDWIITQIKHILGNLKEFEENFKAFGLKFIKSGLKGDLNLILNQFQKEIEVSGKEMVNMDLFHLLKEFFNQSIVNKSYLRVIDLESSVNYFSEMFKNSTNIIQESLPKFLYFRRLRILNNTFIEEVKKQFINEQEPAKILAYKYIDEFKEFLKKKIEVSPILMSNEQTFGDNTILREFQAIVSDNINEFFEDINLGISDIVSFAELNIDPKLNKVKEHIESFKKFSKQMHFLLSYVLRYSTINRYLKEENDDEIADPVTFSSRFHRFLEKRLSGVNIEWKSHVLDWIKDYTKIFFKLEADKSWTLKEIYDDFINYFEEREKKAQNSEEFSRFLDAYISKESDAEIKSHLMKFLEQYQYFIGIKSEFPRYVKEKIEKSINRLKNDLKTYKPIDYFYLNEQQTLSKYIRERELKYFSKLIPLPKTLILKENLSHDERKLFKGDLFHVFEFKFWGEKNVNIKLSDNFNEVYREWLREL
ncbi:MAG: hypothetical protein GF317_01960 [Candidatus Lokiarchaeota archaeon]|nr:hypothetical protein [Candidatus Lokiarchaeota archaeon]MBD3198706.1 hypothetical protein [Candidatus Lokiarchaeota archaeon]